MPDERDKGDGWKDGYGGTRYMSVTLEVDSKPASKPPTDSLFLGGDGAITRGVRIANDERLIEPLDYNKLR